MDTAMPQIAPAGHRGPAWLHPDYFTAALDRIDPVIAEAITDEHVRQRDVIELIASENIVSQAVLEAQGSVLTSGWPSIGPQPCSGAASPTCSHIQAFTPTWRCSWPCWNKATPCCPWRQRPGAILAMVLP